MDGARLVRRVLVLAVCAATVLAFTHVPYPSGCPLRFRITLDGNAMPQGASGRLLVLMSNAGEKRERLSAGFVPDGTWLSGTEVEHIAPGEAIEFDPSAESFPKPFSHAGRGSYQFMAVLDPDHSYAREGQDAGDLYGPVVQAPDLDPEHGGMVELVLDRITKARRALASTEDVKLVELQSPILSAFWGRPIIMRAGVVLPPGYRTSRRRYPAVYIVHGFGGSHRTAWTEGPDVIGKMRDGKRMEMVYVYLDASFPTGHHEFADSANNGPWGRALTREFIPHIERNFRLIARPGARFLTGHSSGGWSTLWLQITYPKLFGGAWSTSPDPVDFRSFTGIDATSGSDENAYRTRDGHIRNLVTSEGRDVASWQEFARYEEVKGHYGGQLASFEWVFSPKGPDGRPMKMFNRVTGDLDPEVLTAWQKYDLRLTLERNWSALAPRLRGKLHIICGGEDTFHLEEAIMLLCAFLESKRASAACEIVPGRDHSDLYQPYKTYPNGLDERIAAEMAARYRTAAAELSRKPGGTTRGRRD